jgi:hypothetical protein
LWCLAGGSEAVIIIICRSKVVNNGKTIKVAESEIFSVANGFEKLVSKAMFTQMAVPAEVIQTKTK